MKAFAVKNNPNNVFKKTPNDSIFYVICHHYLTVLSGVVYGCLIENGDVFYKRVENIKNLDILTTFEYVEADMKNTFVECSNDLINKKHVFFVGTPCQIGALIHYLNFKHIPTDTLLTADIFCRGLALKKYWNKYLKELNVDKMDLKVNFRDKKVGRQDLLISIKNKDFNLIENHLQNCFMGAFLNNYILNKNCYNCSFKGENRHSDITIGNFLGVQKFYPEYCYKKGVSLLIIRNEEKNVLKLIKKECKVNEVDPYLIFKNNKTYFESVNRPYDYDNKINLLEHSTFLETFVNLNIPKESFKNKMKKFFKSILEKRNFCLVTKKHVGIITDYGFSNFGNRLQNFALRYILQLNGYKTINITNHGDETFFGLRYFNKRDYKKNDPHLYKKQINIRTCDLRTGSKFAGFSYTKNKKKFISKFKNIILGSDQIWNPNYNLENLTFNLGLFGTDICNTNVFSYGASFGVSELPNNLKYIYSHGLANLKSVGLRENHGLSLVKEFDIEAEMNLDPTLLLSKKEWELFVNKYHSIQNLKEKYIFKYLLKSKEKYQITKDFKNLKMIDIMDRNCIYFSCNHFDFVNFISNSQLVITDSFHAFVFSIIFKKKILLLPREGMESRLKSLCEIVGIKYETNKIIDLNNIKTEKLEELKEKSLTYIKENLR